MHKRQVSILLLQETHFHSDSTPSCSNRYFNRWIHSTNPTQKSKGVSIAFHKTLPIELLDQVTDPQGRYVFVKILLWGTKFTIANVYLPNTHQVPSALQYLKILAGFTEGKLILGGDFNTPLDPLLDSSTSRSSISFPKIRALKRTIYNMHLIDVWRILYPDSRNYTHFSNIHQSYSRIDYFLVEHGCLDWSPNCEIDPMVWSDHSPIFLTLTIPSTPIKEWTWRLNDSLLTEPGFETQIAETISNFFTDHTSDDTSPPMKWEALKAVLRGRFIQMGARMKKERSTAIVTAVHKLRTLETTHKRSPTVELLTEVSSARTQLRELYEASARTFANKLAFHQYKFRDKCGRSLARTLHTKQPNSFIPHIRDSSGKTVSSPSEMGQVFRDFYQSLYNIPAASSTDPPLTTAETQALYIEQTALPTLDGETIEDLEAPISEDEVARAITSTPSGKSPGPDGFTPKFYKQFATLLTPFLTKVFNSISERSVFPPQTLEAHITLIPKPDKDLNVCANYRPISLIGVDLKVYAKILANRLQPLLPRLIHLDQVGFVSGREARDNTLKTLLIADYARAHNIPLCLLTVDAEKAFDRVDWQFLRLSLQQLGLGQNMISRIMSLYTSPSARIRLNGSLSPKFTIHNGTRQGCPLSPILYVIVMEHLAIALRNNPAIHGVRVGPLHTKIALFADDLLIFVTQPQISLPSIMQEFQRYGEVSNFKVNLNKSEILNISLPTAVLQQLTTSFPFKTSSTSIRYLGIHIPTVSSQLFSSNFTPLLTRTQADLTTYASKQLSWLGRVNVLKMDVLPRFLYLFQTIPIYIPTSFFKRLRQIFSKFIWQGRRPRIKHDTMILPKVRGGAGVPDASIYHKAAVLVRIVDWFHHSSSKLWVQLEKYLNEADLCALPWTPMAGRGDGLFSTALTRQTLQIWDRMISASKLSKIQGPMTPLFGTPAFPPAANKLRFGPWSRDSHRRLAQVLRADPSLRTDIPSRTELGTSTMWLQRGQITSYIRTFSSISEILADPSDFDELLLQPDPPIHVVSLLYSLLLNEYAPDLPTYTQKWEAELQHSISPTDWQKSFILTHRISLATKNQEKGFKLLTRWYRCPVDIKKFNPSLTDVCWRCLSSSGTMLHIWWACPPIWKLWQKVFDLYSRLMATSIKPTPEIALLSILPGPLKSIKKDVLRHFLAAVRTVIPRHWKTTDVPSLGEWVVEVDQIRDLERLLAEEVGKEEQFTATWTSWSMFRYSDEFSLWVRDTPPLPAD